MYLEYLGIKDKFESNFLSVALVIVPLGAKQIALLAAPTLLSLLTIFSAVILYCNEMHGYSLSFATI